MLLLAIIWVSLFSSLTIGSNPASELYIAPSNNTISFQNGSIECTKNKDCYIRCLAPGSCTNTRIACHSRICDVQCAPESCVNSTITINQTTLTHAETKLNCTGHGSCYKLNFNAVGLNATASVFSTLVHDGSNPAIEGSQINIKGYESVNIINDDAGYTLQCDNDHCISNTYTMDGITNILHISHRFNDASFRPEVFNIIDSIHINVSCSGFESCHGYVFDVTHQKSGYNSSIDVDCHGSASCKTMNISVAPSDQLGLFCVDGDEICLGATVLISPRFDQTHLVCNGAQGSKSCNEMVILVPRNPDDLFLHPTFVNEEDNDNLPYAGSIDAVRIRCLNEELCTEFTPFPLLWTAVPAPSSVANRSLYLGNYSYNYLFKHIWCRAGEECFIDCKKSYTCSSTFVECDAGSKCHIQCREPYQCDNLVVKAYGDEVDLTCGAEQSCNEALIWLDEKKTLNISASDVKSLSDLTFSCPLQKLTGRYTVHSDDGVDSYHCVNECCPYYKNQTVPFEPTIPSRSKEDSKKMDAEVIVAIIAIVLVVVLTVGAVVYWLNKRKKSEADYVQMEDHYTSNY